MQQITGPEFKPGNHIKKSYKERVKTMSTKLEMLEKRIMFILETRCKRSLFLCLKETINAYKSGEMISAASIEFLLTAAGAEYLLYAPSFPIYEFVHMANSEARKIRMNDSEKKRFDGDLIICDPAVFLKVESTVPMDFSYKEKDDIYIPSAPERDDYHSEGPECIEVFLKREEFYLEAMKNHNEELQRDFEYASCGERLNKVGINRFLTKRTIFDNWKAKCYINGVHHTSFETNSGYVTVADFDEVYRYNPEVYEYTNYASVSDFHGEVQYVTEKKINNNLAYYAFTIKGNGVTSKGEPISFYISN